LATERILVVDDDESIRQIVRICLSDEGYDVFEASNGLAALALLPECRPDLILLDLRMPVMDGWEFARLYRLGPGRHVPIVAFIAALNAQQDCAELDAATILTKPFDLDELLDIVRSHIPLAR
jgi:two-component system, chemotaxis family, chemotaxis protein CheY